MRQVRHSDSLLKLLYNPRPNGPDRLGPALGPSFVNCEQLLWFRARVLCPPVSKLLIRYPPLLLRNIFSIQSASHSRVLVSFLSSLCLGRPQLRQSDLTCKWENHSSDYISHFTRLNTQYQETGGAKLVTSAIMQCTKVSFFYWLSYSFIY